MMFVQAALAGYLCGSIATAVWISKYLYGQDIRTQGSGNAGATNIYRVLGIRPALAVTLIDIAKGAVPTFLVTRLASGTSQDLMVLVQMTAGSAAVIGHCFPLFAGFRGGKGVATGAGMLLVLFPVAVPVCILIFALVVWRTRYVSLASMVSAAFLPGIVFTYAQWGGTPQPLALYALAMALPIFVLFTHRSNVARLRNGSESKIS